MKNLNRNVIVEKPDRGKLFIKRSRGILTVDDLFNVLDTEDIDDVHVLFIKRTEYAGWPSADDEPTSVVLHSIDMELTDSCPCCSRSWEDWRAQGYEAMFQQGYEAGRKAATDEHLTPLNTAV